MVIYIYHILYSLVYINWYQQCVTVHHVPKCMGCYKVIVGITGRLHCFQTKF